MSVDYRNFTRNGKTESGADAAGNEYKWWTCTGKACADAIVSLVGVLRSRQGIRIAQLQTNARLYGNLSVTGPMGLNFSRVATNAPGNRNRVTFNGVQSCTDTLASKMSKNKPAPTFQATGGNYKAKRKAKNLDKFLAGVFYENHAYDMGARSIVDCCTFGDAMTYVHAEMNADGDLRVKWDRVLAIELLIDEVEAVSTNGNIRQMHREKIVDREQCRVLFPDNDEIIDKAPPAKIDDQAGSYVADMIIVRESWHLPSGPDAKDGKHVISVEGGCLVEEEWKRPRFPFAKLPWSQRLFGYWSQALAEQLQGLQLDVNRCLHVIQQSQHLMGSFKVWLKNGGKVVLEHMNNEIFALIRSEVEPKYLTPPAVQPEIYATVDKRIEQMYQQAGLSQLTASGVKPAGLDSGEAQRVYNNIEDARFVTFGHQYERYFLDLAELSIETVEEIAAHGKAYKVRLPDRDATFELDWRDVKMPRDSYTLQCMPVSALPNEPAGRIQTVTELMQANIIDQKRGARLLDFPDLNEFESLETATEDFLTMKLDGYIDDAAPVAYQLEGAYDDLALALKLGLEYYARYKTQGLEDERLDLIRQWIDQAKALIQKMNAPPPIPAGGPPQAAPAAPPISPLLPNAPGLKAAA